MSEDNVIEMDLGNLNSVKNFSDSFKENFNTLDSLINNAGIMAYPETRIGNNWESQFAINHIGHFLLTNELINVMSDVEGARFVSYRHQLILLLASYGMIFTFKVLSTINGWLTVNLKQLAR